MFPTFTFFYLPNGCDIHPAQCGKACFGNAIAQEIFNLNDLVSSQFCIMGFFAFYLRSVFSTVNRIFFGSAFIEMFRVKTGSVMALMQNHLFRQISVCNSEANAMHFEGAVSHMDIAVSCDFVSSPFDAVGITSGNSDPTIRHGFRNAVAKFFNARNRGSSFEQISVTARTKTGGFIENRLVASRS